MGIFRNFFNVFLFGCIFISICAVALCIATNILLKLPFNQAFFYIFVFSATLLQYNLHYLHKKTPKPGSQRLEWAKNNSGIQYILITFALAGLAYSVLKFSQREIIILAIIGVLSLSYSIPLLFFLKRKRLKDYGVPKILSLTLVWTLVTVVLPAENISFLDPELTFLFIRRFCFMFVLCLAFDIRDEKFDRKENVFTIPVVYGLGTSFRLMKIALGIFFLITIIYWRMYGTAENGIAMMISGLVTYFVVAAINEFKTEVYFLLIIDGMMLLQALLILAFNYKSLLIN